GGRRVPRTARHDSRSGACRRISLGAAGRWRLPPCRCNGGHMVARPVRLRGRGAGRSRPGVMNQRGARPISGSSLGRKGSPTGLVVAALVCGAVTVAAQVPARAPPVLVESVTVVPGTIYRVGAVGRFIYGDHYRDLWTTPLTVPVLSLDDYGGGLRPFVRGGSHQTKSLRLNGADGREYVFRSIDKDPSPSLPPELRGTYAK